MVKRGSITVTIFSYLAAAPLPPCVNMVAYLIWFMVLALHVEMNQTLRIGVVNRRWVSSWPHVILQPLRCSTTNNNEQHPDLNWDSKAAPKLDWNEDYYSVLECDVSVDGKELKKGYYKLVYKYHPDNIENQDTQDLCNKQMMVINGAYKILKNPLLRSLYDKQRSRRLYGAKAGITERSVAVDNDDASANSSTPPRPRPRQTPSQDQQSSSATGAGAGAAGFGGAWTKRRNDEAEYDSARGDRERELERQRRLDREESAYRRAERIRQDRAREWEEAGGEPQPQRQPINDHDESRSRSSYGAYGATAEPVRPDDSYRHSNALDEVEEFLRTTGSRVSSEVQGQVTNLKAKLTKLRSRQAERERSVYSDTRDWGEVTDMRLIKQRLEDINELKVLSQQVADLEEEIADVMLRGRTTGNGSSTSNAGPRRMSADESRPVRKELTKTLDNQGVFYFKDNIKDNIFGLFWLFLF